MRAEEPGYGAGTDMVWFGDAVTGLVFSLGRLEYSTRGVQPEVRSKIAAIQL